jgi:hypothetical protein
MGRSDDLGCCMWNIWGIFFFMTPVTLVQSWRELLPDLEDGLQDFCNEEISSFEILGVWCAMRSLETST